MERRRHRGGVIEWEWGWEGWNSTTQLKRNSSTDAPPAVRGITILISEFEFFNLQRLNGERESLTQHYDGLGGRERQLFQTFSGKSISSSKTFQGRTISTSQPFPAKLNSKTLTKFPSQPAIQFPSQPATKKRKMTASKNTNQMKTIDKFFGGFDTPWEKQLISRHAYFAQFVTQLTTWT